MNKLQNIPIFSLLLVTGLLLSACGGQIPGGASVRSLDGGNSQVNDQIQAAGTLTGATLNPAATDDSGHLEGTPEPGETETPDALKTPESSETQEVNGGQDGADDNEVVGAVVTINGNQVTVNGQIYTIDNLTQIKDQIAAGDLVKIHFVVNADGSLTITEIAKTDPSALNDGSGSGGTDDGAAHDAGDDKGGSHGAGSGSGQGGSGDHQDDSGSGGDH